MKYALLVIDIQRWFFRTEERTAGLSTLIPNVNNLIVLCERAGVPIIHVLTVHTADKSSWNLYMKRENVGVLIAGTQEAEELPNVSKSPTHETLIKTRMSAFIRTDLEDRLKKQGITTLILSGVFTHGCVGRTGMDAYEYDFDVIIATDAIFSHQPERAEAVFTELKIHTEAEFLSNAEIAQKLGLEA